MLTNLLVTYNSLEAFGPCLAFLKIICQSELPSRTTTSENKRTPFSKCPGVSERLR